MGIPSDALNKQAQSFNALTGSSLHTLILGTMPGQASLKADEYYAHPRNAFWPVLCAIMRSETPSWHAPSSSSYVQRCEELTSHGYGLWDVLAYCERPGSLDSAIVKQSEIPNDIASLIHQSPNLHTIAFNGRTAEKLFKRHVSLSTVEKPLRTVTLPSSSPAMASLTLEQKYKAWKKLLV